MQREDSGLLFCAALRLLGREALQDGPPVCVNAARERIPHSKPFPVACGMEAYFVAIDCVTELDNFLPVPLEFGRLHGPAIPCCGFGEKIK